MPTTAPPPDAGEFEALLAFVAQAAIDDISNDAFLRRFHASAATLAPTMFAVIEDPAARRAAIGHFGRVFWNRMPKPQHGWRAMPTPKPERNGPCPCGSGKKFKQCCQPDEAPAHLIPELNMLKFVLDLWPESKAHELPLRRMNPEALADVASQWLTEGDGERGVRLLEPLFNDPANVDERYICCFDALCDVYPEVGLHDERDLFVARISAHGDKYLASAALQRATAIASDEGDYDAAWERFGQAMRLTPDDPSLSHLEVIVLMSQGRVDEAKARAAMWAARLRRMNRPEYENLIEFLEQTAVNPDRALLKMAERDLPEDQTWSDLLDAAPAVELMYEIDTDPTPDDFNGPGRANITMKPLPSLARVERDWRDRFFVEKPALVDLYGEATTVCEEFAAVAEFLRAHPAAWQSFAILDDLVLIARDWFDEDDEALAENTVLLELTDRAVKLLRMCMAAAGDGKPIVAWDRQQNRPALRLVAQRIDALLDSFADDADALEISELQKWMLELNPNDNHGYRNPVMQDYVLAGDAQRAIDLAGHYPDDVGDMPFHLALALFQSGRKVEAAIAWARGAHSTPVIAATLLAHNPKRPDLEDDEYEVFGGPAHGWRYRLHMLDAWTECGALAWAQTLPRVPVPKLGKLVRGKTAKAGGRQIPATLPLPGTTGELDETTLLQSLASHGFAVAPLHGTLTAVTLSPAMMLPGQWLGIALGFRKGEVVGGIDQLNAAMEPLMGLYNCINSSLRMKRGEGYMPSPELRTADPVQATEWARGFMRIVEQGRAAWRDKTSTPQGKMALTTIERVAAGMVADDRLRQESVALGLATPPFGTATWHDVLAAATRMLAAQ